eukprot:TCALIF_06719-PA protein Name:"Protein of unknown function" AED:0.19 eAED:0.19 QI:182/1/0.5/1/0/0.5/2/261/49
MKRSINECQANLHHHYLFHHPTIMIMLHTATSNSPFWSANCYVYTDKTQ